MAEETATPSKEEVVSDTTGVAAADEPKTSVEDSAVISQSVSFKEESNRVADLQDPEKIALDEFKTLIQQALNNHEFTLPPPPPPAPESEKSAVEESTAAAEETAPATEAIPPVPVPVPVEEDGSKTVEAIEESVVVSVAKEEEAAPPVIETKEESTPGGEKEEEEATPPPPPEEVFIWGIPLIGDEKSDTVLLKFLRARDFKVKDAFTMLKNTVLWRKEFGIDGLVEEDLGGIEQDLDKVVFMSGFDKEGHPVCYNVYGEFQNKELYQKTFSDEEKSQKFLRWRIQFLEKSIIQNLDFTPGAVCTIVQVNDLKNSPGPLKKELRQATNQALSILQDNYPEFVAKQVFINVPWWYLTFNRMISPFLTLRTKSKFVFAGPSKSAETLFKYVAPEQVPVQYGGLSKEGEQEFSTADAVTDVTIKPTTKQTVEIPVSETSLLVWELRVIGWDVSYGVEFVPSAEDGYTIIVQKTRKIAANSDEAVINNNFKVGEAGKVVLTIDNSTSKKKKLLYRFKTKPSE